MRRKAVLGLFASTLLGSTLLSGCASQIATSASDASSVVGLISTVATGKGLSDHLLSIVTGEDCNIGEGLTREDRDICEVEGSPSTQKDFKGVFAEAKAVGGDAYIPAGVTTETHDFNGDPSAVWAAMKTAQEVKAAEIAAQAQAQAVASVEPRLSPRLEIKPDDTTLVASVRPAKIERADFVLRPARKRPAAKISTRRWDGEGGPLILASEAVTTPLHVSTAVHDIQNGEPVVILKIVPPSQAVSQSQVEPNAADEVALQSEVGASSTPTSDAVVDERPGVSQELTAVGTGDPDLIESESIAETEPPEARYPLARPSVKPNSEFGIGGALNPEPPRAPASVASPQPVKANSVERQRRNAERKTKRREAAKASVAQAAPTKPVTPPAKDPLDLPAAPRIIELDAVDAMGFPSRLKESAEPSSTSPAPDGSNPQEAAAPTPLQITP